MIAPVTKDFHVLLDKITNPSRGQVDWGHIMALCDRTAAADDGARLLAPILLERIRNRQERVAMHALNALEALVKNQNTLFEEVVGKYKFLNELIRLISAKYSLYTPEPVRKRILGLIQSWAYMLPKQAKIIEAYEMLKRQGQNFPVISEEQSGGESFLDYNTDKTKDRFQQEEKEDELQALLQSTNPEDLKRANKLIKQLVLTENSQQKSERKVREDLTVVKSNAELMQEMLYSLTAAPEEDDVLQELVANCRNMSPKVKKLLDQTSTDSIDFRDVEAVNTLLVSALSLYDRKSQDFKSGKMPSRGNAQSTSNDIDLLLDLDAPAPAPQGHQPTSLLNDELAALGLGSMQAPQPTAVATATATANNRANLLDDLLSGPISTTPPQQQKQHSAPAPGMNGADLLGGSASSGSNVGIDLLGGLGSSVLGSTVPARATQSPFGSFTSAPTTWTDVTTLKLDIGDVKPAAVAPVDVLNTDGLRVQFYLTSNKLSKDVLAILITFVNSNAFSLENFSFQVAPPKEQQVCLLTASQLHLPAFNPISGASSVTQIMLLNRKGATDALRLRYKVQYTSVAGGAKEHTGQVDDIFPNAD